MAITRRAFGMTALGAALAPAMPSLPAFAKAPKAGTQAPGFYRIGLGDIELTAISDGILPLETKLYSGDQAAVGRMLEANFVSKEATPTSVNAWVVNTGDRLVLIDTGTSTAMGAGLGKVAANLKAAGLEPADFDAVIITHLHPDHGAGLITGEAIAFPNATLHLSEAEYGFWTNETIYAGVPDGVKPFFDMARKFVKPYAAAGKLVQFKDGAEVLPGITAVLAPGHTMGHTMFRLASAGKDLLIWADIVHNVNLQFADPKIAIAFDTDQALAVTTRQKVMDMVATDRVIIGGSHLPFPGLGHVAKEGSAYRYVPLPWSETI